MNSDSYYILSHCSVGDDSSSSGHSSTSNSKEILDQGWYNTLCFCLLEEWLGTDHGDPKTWTVLLAAMRKTKPFHVIAMDIEDDIRKM